MDNHSKKTSSMLCEKSLPNQVIQNECNLVLVEGKTGIRFDIILSLPYITTLKCTGEERHCTYGESAPCYVCGWQRKKEQRQKGKEGRRCPHEHKNTATSNACNYLFERYCHFQFRHINGDGKTLVFKIESNNLSMKF